MPRRWMSEEQACQDRAIDGLDWAAQAFYGRLVYVVDDYGVFPAVPEILRSRCFPFSVDRVRTADVARWLVACETAGLITLFEAEHKPYLQLTRKLWDPRASASKYAERIPHSRTKKAAVPTQEPSLPGLATPDASASIRAQLRAEADNGKHLRAPARKGAQMPPEAEAGTVSVAKPDSEAVEGSEGLTPGTVPGAFPASEQIVVKSPDATSPTAPASPAHLPPPPPPAATAKEQFLLEIPASGERSWGLTRQVLDRLDQLFPEVDVLGEARLCAAYYVSNEGKRLNPRSVESALSRWITNDVRDGKALPRKSAPSALASLIDEACAGNGGGK